MLKSRCNILQQIKGVVVLPLAVCGNVGNISASLRTDDVVLRVFVALFQNLSGTTLEF